jgi:hypothetical protein
MKYEYKYEIYLLALARLQLHSKDIYGEYGHISSRNLYTVSH